MQAWSGRASTTSPPSSSRPIGRSSHRRRDTASRFERRIDSMFRRILVALTTFLFATALLAQSAPSDVEQRLRALEEKVAAMQKAAPTVDFSEIQREIDVLSKEIEALKTG